MKQSLNIKLSQGLKLTPQLQQSIKLLQLSVVELNTEIQEMLDTNPLLEEEEVKIETSSSEQEKQAETDADNQIKEQDLQEQFETRQSLSNSSGSGGESSDIDVYATSSSQQSTEDELVWQVNMTNLSDRDKMIAEAIIYSLNSAGYLLVSDEDIVDILPQDMEFEADEVAAIVKLIQTFEPNGIAARNLQERLLLILTNKERKNPEFEHDVTHYLARCIVENHLDELANRNLNVLKTELDIDQDQLIDAVQYIQNINPYIETPEDENDNQYIIPDIIIKEVNHSYVVQINPSIKKHVKLNDSYISIPKEDLNGEASKYITDSLQEAKWFIKSLNNRYDTCLLYTSPSPRDRG